MKLRTSVLFASLAALISLAPAPCFSNGKRPPAVDEEDEDSQIQEEVLSTGQRVPKKTRKNVDEEPTAAQDSKPATPTRAKSQPQSQPQAQAESQAPSNEPAPVPEETQKPMPPREIAKEQPYVPSGDMVHTVWIWQESKDCLWKLAKTYYKDPWAWKKIYLENRNTILDPNVIFPKQKIVIPPKDSSVQ